MIRSLSSLAPGSFFAAQVSRQKKDAIFAMASRIAVLAERSRGGEGRAVADSVLLERRRSLRRGLELVAAGADAEDLGRELDPASAPDPGTALELAVARDGLAGLLSGQHPFILMRRMCAHLGPEYFDKASAQIQGRLKKHRPRTEALVVPGDFPDVVRSLALDPRSLELALRSAGREIAAAALAGAPQESVDLAKPFFGKIGGAALEDDAAYLLARLSGDEIAQAQAAFLEIVRDLEERGELRLGGAEDLGSDPRFVDELTRAVLGLDGSLIRHSFRDIEGGALAMAMQGMEPEAHEHILGALSKKEQLRILNAIDDADPLPRRAVQAAGSALAEKLLAAAIRGPAASPAETLERLAKVRDWED